MQQIYLNKILQTLDESERRRLRKFVQSPYHNQRADVAMLVEYLLDPKRNPIRERVFKHLFPEKPYNDALLRQTTHWATQTLHHFLAIETFEKQLGQQELLTASALSKKGFSDLLEKKGSQSIVQNTQRAALGIRQAFDFEELRYESMAKNKRENVDILEHLVQHFTDFTVAEIFRIACMSLNKRSLTNQNIEPPFLQEALAAVDSGKYNDNLAIMQYYNSYRALTSGESHYFEQLETGLTASLVQLPKPETRDFLMNAINYAIKRHNKGEKEWTRKVLDLYRFGLQSGLLLENNQLSKYAYSNISTLALLLEEWDWTWQFIADYRQFLDIEDADTFFHYNLANWFFRKKDYQNTLIQLQSADIREALQGLEARKMLLVSYYETEAWEALASLLDSYTIFLKRNQKRVGYHAAHFSNLLRFTRSLLHFQRDKSGIEVVLAELKMTKEVAAKDWLLEKYEGFHFK
jgi:hypothetical protein